MSSSEVISSRSSATSGPYGKTRPVVGLTGGIASGKSTAAAMFAELGISCIDADDAARAVVAAGEPALESIAERFGREILLESGELNRAALRSIVFADAEARGWLERLTHPLVHKLIVAWRNDISSDYGILVSPLMLERRQNHSVDRVLLVDVPEAKQITRVQQRDGSSEAEARAIMASQMAREDKLALADDVIVNDSDLETLRAAVMKQHAFYLSLYSKQEQPAS